MCYQWGFFLSISIVECVLVNHNVCFLRPGDFKSYFAGIHKLIFLLYHPRVKRAYVFPPRIPCDVNHETLEFK